ncbi:MAG TPA: tyrosine-type recombinase/integrase [Acidimicrobiales bacterium]|nr:tyrosine-type recombinase/integrase [Acidimicrobiales bacterium]
MSSITKMPSGRWRARYRDPNGRSRSKTFARKADAQGFLDDTSTDVRRGEWTDPRQRRLRFDEWADRWWSTTARLAPATRRGYWTKLEHHVRPYFTGRRLLDIDFLDVEEFIAELHRRELAAKTIRECVTILSLIFRGAVHANVRRDNPAAGHRIDVRRKVIGTGDVLDMAQVRRLVDTTPKRWKSAVWVLALCGLRPSELCGLRVGDVDFARRTLHVSVTRQPVPKFDGNRRRVVEGPPKTAAGDRTIPLPEWLCDELAAMLAERRGDSPSIIDRSVPLFVTRYGNPVSRDDFRQRIMRPALRRAGLPETIRTYDLRHSHASLLIDLGANPLAVAQRMGHSDPAMTLRVYGHLFEGVQERLTEQLDELREQADASAATAVVVPLAGHNGDTRDTKKTRNRGKIRSTSVESG